MIIEIALPTFYSAGDERRLFEGLYDIRAVRNIQGTGRGLVLTIVNRELNRDALYELIALLWRYGIPLAPLAAMADIEKFAWLKSKSKSKMYWYASMFGSE